MMMAKILRDALARTPRVLISGHTVIGMLLDVRWLQYLLRRAHHG